MIWQAKLRIDPAAKLLNVDDVMFALISHSNPVNDNTKRTALLRQQRVDFPEESLQESILEVDAALIFLALLL
jgi:hypothetical protein